MNQSKSNEQLYRSSRYPTRSCSARRQNAGLIRQQHALCEYAFVGWLYVSDITDRRASLIDEDDIGYNDIGVGIALSGGGKGFESSGQIEIVGILPAYPVASGALQSLVESVHLAAI